MSGARPPPVIVMSTYPQPWFHFGSPPPLPLHPPPFPASALYPETLLKHFILLYVQCVDCVTEVIHAFMLLPPVCRAFSPLQGFMNQAEYDSVVANMRTTVRLAVTARSQPTR